MTKPARNTQEAIKEAELELASAQTMFLLCKQGRSRPAVGSSRRLLDQDVAMASLEVHRRQMELDKLTKEASAP